MEKLCGIPLRSGLGFVRWMCQFLLDSIHPGGTFERSSTSLEMLLLMVRIWKDDDGEHDGKHILAPVMEKRSVLVLLRATVVTWDRVRELSCQILSLKFILAK